MNYLGGTLYQPYESSGQKPWGPDEIVYYHTKVLAIKLPIETEFKA